MNNTLAEIVNYKQEIVAERKAALPFSEVEQRAKAQAPAKGFAHAMRSKVDNGGIALIAELKKASPSKGLIRAEFDPVTLAEAYQQGGATCLSVLTDERYFQGSDNYLQQVIAHTPLPVLRKDFMVDSYQIAESRMLGADCILLILAALSDAQAKELEAYAHALGMDVLAEVHDEEELQRALQHLTTPLIGINNRNLKTLEVDIHTSIALRALVPDDRLVVCESGIVSYDDVMLMRSHGMHCFLVGESLMRHADVEAATKRLLGRKG